MLTEGTENVTELHSYSISHLLCLAHKSKREKNIKTKTFVPHYKVIQNKMRKLYLTHEEEDCMVFTQRFDLVLANKVYKKPNLSFKLTIFISIF